MHACLPLLSKWKVFHLWFYFSSASSLPAKLIWWSYGVFVQFQFVVRRDEGDEKSLKAYIMQFHGLISWKLGYTHSSFSVTKNTISFWLVLHILRDFYDLLGLREFSKNFGSFDSLFWSNNHLKSFRKKNRFLKFLKTAIQEPIGTCKTLLRRNFIKILTLTEESDRMVNLIGDRSPVQVNRFSRMRIWSTLKIISKSFHENILKNSTPLIYFNPLKISLDSWKLVSILENWWRSWNFGILEN